DPSLFCRPFLSCGRKPATGEIQVGEREQRGHLRAVLGDAALADLAVAELAFDDTEHVLDLRTHLAETAVLCALPLGQIAAWLRLLFNRPHRAGRVRRALLLVTRVALVAYTAVSSSRIRLAITFAS